MYQKIYNYTGNGEISTSGGEFYVKRDDLNANCNM
nr:MAG TPA: hypothetical protein [Caudoviricetes sp.]